MPDHYLPKESDRAFRAIAFGDDPQKDAIVVPAIRVVHKIVSTFPMNASDPRSSVHVTTESDNHVFNFPNEEEARYWRNQLLVKIENYWNGRTS